MSFTNRKDPPRTWRGLTRHRTRFDISVNQVVGRMIKRKKMPTKEEICDELGLDYDRATNRNRISNSLYQHKKIFDYAWRVLYEPSASYRRDLSRFLSDTQGFNSWKRAEPDLYQSLRAYGCREEEIKHFWVMSKMWDNFVDVANQYNLFLFVGEGIYYKQPDFWEYTTKQIQSARRLGKGIITILERHKDLGMMLTSGESINVALLTADDTLKMITDGKPHRHRCEICLQSGDNMEFDSQDLLFQHWKNVHQRSLGAT